MSVKCVAYAEAEVTSIIVDGPQRTLSISEACLYAPHPCVRHYRPVWTMVKCSGTQDLRVGVQALWKGILSIPEPAASIREAALGASGHRVVVSPCQGPEPTTPIWERHSELQVVMSPTAPIGPRVYRPNQEGCTPCMSYSTLSASNLATLLWIVIKGSVNISSMPLIIGPRFLYLQIPIPTAGEGLRVLSGSVRNRAPTPPDTPCADGGAA
jgi:hypothetical protein